VRNALQLQVVTLSSAIVEQENGAIASRKITFESEYLPAISKRISRQHAKLRKRIEYDPAGLYSIDFAQHRSRGITQLDI
jgi:hypothetical protein